MAMTYMFPRSLFIDYWHAQPSELALYCTYMYGKDDTHQPAQLLRAHQVLDLDMIVYITRKFAKHSLYSRVTIV